MGQGGCVKPACPAGWQFMLQDIASAAGADAAEDVQPPSCSCAGGCAALASPHLVQGSVLSGGLQSGIIKAEKTSRIIKSTLCPNPAVLGRAPQGTLPSVLGSSAAKEEQGIIPANFHPIPGT